MKRYRTKRVVWSQDAEGKWNGLILKGRADQVHKAVADEVARCKAENLEGHVTDGFNRISEWTCQS